MFGTLLTIGKKLVFVGKKLAPFVSPVSLGQLGTAEDKSKLPSKRFTIFILAEILLAQQMSLEELGIMAPTIAHIVAGATLVTAFRDYWPKD